MRLTSALLVLISLCTVSAAFGQVAPHLCKQHTATEHFREEHPELEPFIRQAEDYLEEFTRNYVAQRGVNQEVYIIPVVFHIIHNNGTENISNEQVLDAVRILNRDFRKLNNDTALVIDQFANIIGDAGIEFRLAARDPNGNCTTGITRTVSALTNVGDDQVKNLIHWPRNKYLNIYVCASANGAAGYTYMPATVDGNWGADNDGINIQATYVGAIGTGSVTTSRALTHEVGHWLNLYHTWGPTNDPGEAVNCNFDDLVEDTPNTMGFTTCQLSGNTCGGGVDNVQNYMEYSYCSRMFTQGQCDRMRAAVLSPIAERNELITQSNLIATGVIDPPLCMADFGVNNTTVCLGTPVTFTDRSYHGITSWTWNFGDGVTLSGSDPAVHQNPEHLYENPGTYTVSLTVSNGTSQVTDTQTSLVTVLSTGMLSGPLAEGFENGFPANNWFIENENNDVTWEVTPSAFYSGTKCIRLRNFSNQVLGNSDAFTSPTIDMTGMDSIYVSYKWSYAQKNSTNTDRLRMSVSGNCGTSWVLKKIRTGNTNLATSAATTSMFTPTSISQWGSDLVGMAEDTLMNDHFRVKFEFIGNGGNNVYLDDINIYGVSASGVGMVEYTGDYGLRIFPNPTDDELNIEWKQQSTADVQVRLYNSVGQLCAESFRQGNAAGTHRIALPKQTAGTYTVVIRSGETTLQRKVVFR